MEEKKELQFQELKEEELDKVAGGGGGWKSPWSSGTHYYKCNDCEYTFWASFISTKCPECESTNTTKIHD